MKKVYRSNKEHYKVSIKEAISTIKKCIKLSKSKIISEDNFYKKLLSKSNNKIKTKRNKEINNWQIEILFGESDEQIGGNLKDPSNDESFLKNEYINELHEMIFDSIYYQ